VNLLESDTPVNPLKTDKKTFKNSHRTTKSFEDYFDYPGEGVDNLSFALFRRPLEKFSGGYFWGSI